MHTVIAAGLNTSSGLSWIKSVVLPLALALVGLKIAFGASGRGSMRKTMDSGAQALIGVAFVVGAVVLAGVNVLAPFVH